MIAMGTAYFAVETRTQQPAGKNTVIQSDVPPRILIDEEPTLREVLCDYLDQHGYEPMQAASAAEMDRVMSKTPPDLIVLDTMMPGEDGLSVCRRLSGKGVPIVMLDVILTLPEGGGVVARLTLPLAT